jgi:hypothetical protein
MPSTNIYSCNSQHHLKNLSLLPVDKLFAAREREREREKTGFYKTKFISLLLSFLPSF